MRSNSSYYLTASQPLASLSARVRKGVYQGSYDMFLPTSRALQWCCLNDFKIQNGFSPLHVACNKEHADVVELLLSNGADKEALTEVRRIVDCDRSKL